MNAPPSGVIELKTRVERDVAEHMAAHVEALSAAFKSEDHKEGVAAFLERRPAKFVGR